MTLAEKLTALRAEHKLSQGDLAERLDVSRQSVSKWETGQSVPELDKIVKLADLFNITVDELVRDSEAPSLDTIPVVEPKVKVVYVERRLAPTQVFGVVLLVLGLLNAAWGVWTSYDIWALFSSIAVVLSLPFLLSRKHPFLIFGWVALAVSYLFLNPYTSGSTWGLWGGLFSLYLYFTRPELQDSINLFTPATGIIRGCLALLLIVLTARLWLRKWREKKQAAKKADA